MRPKSDQNSRQLAGQLNVVKLCHDYAVLHMHDQVGLRLSRAERRILGGLQKLLEGDPIRHRRRHRRLPLMIPVELKTDRGYHTGRAINISGGGIYVMLPEALPEGTTLQVRMGGPGGQLYAFNGVVTWSRARGDVAGLGIRFTSVPLTRTITPRHSPIVTEFTTAA